VFEATNGADVPVSASIRHASSEVPTFAHFNIEIGRVGPQAFSVRMKLGPPIEFAPDDNIGVWMRSPKLVVGHEVDVGLCS